MSVHEYRRKADELLNRAIRTTDLKMKGAVLEQALKWHHLAVEANARSFAPRGAEPDTDETNGR
jgi:hypothetical protein